MPVKINVVPRLRSLESVRDRVIGMKVPRSPMAPLSSPHFERKTKLVFTFCKITLNEKRVVEVVWVVSWVEIGIEGFWLILGMAFVDDWVVGNEKGCYWLSNDIVGLVGNLVV